MLNILAKIIARALFRLFFTYSFMNFSYYISYIVCTYKIAYMKMLIVSFRIIEWFCFVKKLSLFFNSDGPFFPVQDSSLKTMYPGDHGFEVDNPS